MGLYTEQGVVSRRDATPDELINEIREAATARHTALIADPPTDASARPGRIFGGVPWDWERLLRNRPLDVWMHEQDIRRAVDLPGGMDSAGARHTAAYLAESLGVVLAKRVGAPAGTTAVLEVGGQPPVAYAVNDAGRGEPLPDAPAGPDRVPAAGARGVRGARRRAARAGAGVGRDQRRRGARPADPRRLRGHPLMRAPADAWRLEDIPDQAGRTALVTGTTLGGLGHHTALELARRGARVVLAGRTPDRLDETARTIREQAPDAELERLVVDLADLSSVRRAAVEAAAYGPIDVLVNNAGVMAPAHRRTVDGLELQMATNHFGPFLLTGLLLPQLVASDAATVVTVSSLMHRVARTAPLGDPRSPEGHYRRWPTYSRSKLANLLFTYELDRRARRAELPVKALAAHPGFAGTHLAANGQYGRSSGGLASILDAGVRAVSQPAHLGAWPTLMAATADLPGSTYCGPSGWAEQRGLPAVVTSNRLSHDESAQRRLWEISEETTGIRYP